MNRSWLMVLLLGCFAAAPFAEAAPLRLRMTTRDRSSSAMKRVSGVASLFSTSRWFGGKPKAAGVLLAWNDGRLRIQDGAQTVDLEHDRVYQLEGLLGARVNNNAGRSAQLAMPVSFGARGQYALPLLVNIEPDMDAAVMATVYKHDGTSADLWDIASMLLKASPLVKNRQQTLARFSELQATVGSEIATGDNRWLDLGDLALQIDHDGDASLMRALEVGAPFDFDFDDQTTVQFSLEQ